MNTGSGCGGRLNRGIRYHFIRKECRDCLLDNFAMNDLRYLTDHYDEKIKRIKEVRAPLNFVFITDMHNRLKEYVLKGAKGQYELAVNAIDSIQYILDRCPEIRFVVSGGDIGNDYDTNPDQFRASSHEVMDALYRLSVPVHCCVGNHDDAIGIVTDRGDDTRPFAILPKEMHSLCMRNNPTEENYYYFDDEELGYRFIFLNTSDKPYYPDENGQYPFGHRLEISNKQAEWFERVLETDRRIIIFSHSPIHNAGIYGSDEYPTGIKPYDDLLNGPRLYYALKKNPKVIAMIAGHVHYDNLLYDDGIVTVTSLCSFAQEWGPGCPKRIIGDISETAFDVFSFTDDRIVITRFGAGEDRTAAITRL